jgi:hypothetical protein
MKKVKNLTAAFVRYYEQVHGLREKNGYLFVYDDEFYKRFEHLDLIKKMKYDKRLHSKRYRKSM